MLSFDSTAAIYIDVYFGNASNIEDVMETKDHQICAVQDIVSMRDSARMQCLSLIYRFTVGSFRIVSVWVRVWWFNHHKSVGTRCTHRVPSAFKIMYCGSAQCSHFTVLGLNKDIFFTWNAITDICRSLDLLLKCSQTDT